MVDYQCLKIERFTFILFCLIALTVMWGHSSAYINSGRFVLKTGSTFGQIGATRAKSRVAAVRQRKASKGKATLQTEEADVVEEVVISSSPFSMKEKEETHFTSAVQLLRKTSPSLSSTHQMAMQHEKASSNISISFAVFGEPMALARHRTTRFGTTYNPSLKLQKNFLEKSKPFMPSTPMEGPIEATLLFYFNRPKSHYGTGKNCHILKEGKSKWHHSRSGSSNFYVKDSFFALFLF